MRILFIVLFWTALGSTGLANVGDVYFCDEIQHMILNREGSSQEALDQFEFKVLEGMIEVEPGSSRFSNRKYFIEYMDGHENETKRLKKPNKRASKRGQNEGGIKMARPSADSNNKKGANEASTTFFVVCLHVVWMFIQTIGFVLEKRNRQVCGSCRA